MKVRLLRIRSVLPLAAAALLLVGTTPAAAANRSERTDGRTGPAAPNRSKATSGRDAVPKLVALPALRRPVFVRKVSKRRCGAGSSKLGILATVDWLVEARGSVSRVDPDAAARRPRASNTPRCVRGPPAAA